MNFKKSDELMLIIENDADKIISRTKTRAAESVFGILIKSIDIFHSNTKFLLQELMNLIDVTENEASISYFIITDQNKTFEIYKPGYWQDPNIKKIRSNRRTSELKSKQITRRRNQQQRIRNRSGD